MKEQTKAFWALFPSMFLIGLFVYGFIGNTFFISLTDWGGVAALAEHPVRNFVGFANYRELFTGFLGGGFRQDLVNALYYSLLLVLGAIATGLLLAMLLDGKPRGEAFFRTVFLFPMALSFIVTGTIWRWLLAPQGGVNILPTIIGFDEPLSFSWLSATGAVLEFNWQNVPMLLLYGLTFLLLVAGLGKLGRRPGVGLVLLVVGSLLGGGLWLWGELLPKALFMEEIHGFNLATVGIIMATVWQYSGYTMALYLAGFTGISQDLRDAAMLDGATTGQYYRYIGLPLVKPITISAIIILSHISLKMFDLIFAMTGPDNGETGHPALNMYLTTFRANDFARGAAIAMILFTIAALFIIPYLISTYRRRGGGVNR